MLQTSDLNFNSFPKLVRDLIEQLCHLDYFIYNTYLGGILMFFT